MALAELPAIVREYAFGPSVFRGMYVYYLDKNVYFSITYSKKHIKFLTALWPAYSINAIRESGTCVKKRLKILGTNSNRTKSELLPDQCAH